MAVLPIKFVGDPVLRRKARKVERVDAPLFRLLNDMVDTMHAANGIGLAGPQVGISKRILVVDIGEGPIKLINPRIVDTDGSGWGPEGCLSIPGLLGQVKRHAEIEVKGLNEHGETMHFACDGLLAVVFQHEIDHLDGKLFIDTAIGLYDGIADPDGDEDEEVELEELDQELEA